MILLFLTPFQKCVQHLVPPELSFRASFGSDSFADSKGEWMYGVFTCSNQASMLLGAYHWGNECFVCLLPFEHIRTNRNPMRWFGDESFYQSHQKISPRFAGKMQGPFSWHETNKNSFCSFKRRALKMITFLMSQNSFVIKRKCQTDLWTFVDCWQFHWNIPLRTRYIILHSEKSLTKQLPKCTFYGVL